jgi:uncharacterized protein YbaP (TraB family)
MKRLITFCCSFFLGIALCPAQSKQVNAEANKSLLWKISGKKLSRPSYLFGTLHLICPDDYVWQEPMQQALKNSSTVAFEMDMDDPSIQSQMMAGLLLKDGRKLQDFYTEEEYRRLSELAAANGIPLQMMERFSPFALISFLYTKAVDCPVPDSYEGNIMKLAQKDGKQIIGLESLADQLNVIQKMNADSVAKQVLGIADDLDSFRSMFNNMLQAYKAQDLPSLYEYIIESPDYKSELESLLYQRNERWIPSITQLISKEPAFIAVGAGHLWGERGVIDLLRKKGYTVEAVR